MAFKTINMIFANDGTLQVLVLTRQDGETNTYTSESGTPANPSDEPQNVLWGGSNALQLVTGSDCVVISGRKYCVG